MSKVKKKKRGLADEQKNERIRLLAWEHCSVATTRHGRMSWSGVSVLIRSSYALNFSPRAYRESKVKKSASYDYAIREKPSKPSLFVKSFACAKIYVYCMHFYRISPDSKIIRKYSFANFFFFFLLLPNQYYFLHLYIACIPGEVNVYVNQVYYRCYRLEKAGSIT